MLTLNRFNQLGLKNVVRALTVFKKGFSTSLENSPTPNKLTAQLIPYFQENVRSRYGDFVFRKAVPNDKEAILNIRKNLYDGLDFMPEFFPQLVSPINGTSFLVLHEDKAVGFLSAMLVDDGESVFVKGLRICEEYEGRKLMPIFGVPVSEWAKTLGANKFVSTYSDTFRPSCRPISKMLNLTYLMDQENKTIQEPDVAGADTVFPIAFDDVAKFFKSNGLSNYLFPYKRILVDMVPYKLMESNTIRMQEISGEHTRVFSDVTDGKNGAKGILSFGTLFKAQKVSHVYGIEIYGTDIDSIRKHIAKHILALKENTSGSVCIMFFLQENVPADVINDMCLDFAMERVNYPGTKYPNWNIQSTYLTEQDFPQTYPQSEYQHVQSKQAGVI